VVSGRQRSFSYRGGKGIKQLQDLGGFLSGGRGAGDYQRPGSYSTISLTADFTELATVQTEAEAHIWVMPGFDVTRATQITQGRNFDREPSWTPSGELVYSSNMAGGSDLYLMDARGGNPKQLTANAGTNGQPSSSPDGRYIVFSSDRTGAPHIWRMDVDGRNQKQLTDKADVNPGCSLMVVGGLCVQRE